MIYKSNKTSWSRSWSKVYSWRKSIAEFSCQTQQSNSSRIQPTENRDYFILPFAAFFLNFEITYNQISYLIDQNCLVMTCE